MGGAGFPTRVKAFTKGTGKIDYIIANCAGVSHISQLTTEQ